jgi:hypothetical protein
MCEGRIQHNQEADKENQYGQNDHVQPKHAVRIRCHDARDADKQWPQSCSEGRQDSLPRNGEDCTTQFPCQPPVHQKVHTTLHTPSQGSSSRVNLAARKRHTPLSVPGAYPVTPAVLKLNTAKWHPPPPPGGGGGLLDSGWVLIGWAPQIHRQQEPFTCEYVPKK